MTSIAHIRARSPLDFDHHQPPMPPARICAFCNRVHDRRSCTEARLALAEPIGLDSHADGVPVRELLPGVMGDDLVRHHGSALDANREARARHRFALYERPLFPVASPPMRLTTGQAWIEREPKHAGDARFCVILSVTSGHVHLRRYDGTEFKAPWSNFRRKFKFAGPTETAE